MLLSTLLLAVRSIRRNLLRSFLTILGIVIGVSAVITMVTIERGTRLGDGTTIRIHDVDLFVDVIGQGPPLVLMHGGPGADHWSMKPFERLADRFTLVFYDHRCNGRSTGMPVGSMTWENLTADADALRDDWSVNPRDVVAMLSGKPTDRRGRVLRSLLSGPIDVDKADYLMRDSLHAGVPYGQHFDRSRLVRSLCLNEAGDGVAITEKGKTAAEMMVFARYVMFSEVYWHHAVRSATAMSAIRP